jgi:site-specific DNA recombinase
MAERVALYLRVSTTRQAEHDLSIPDQRRHGEVYCEAKGWKTVAEYEDGGASAMNDRREAFQRMIGDARGSPRPFDVVLVHSLSRFFRDAYQLEFYIRLLKKLGIELRSMTQDMGQGPESDMIRQVWAIFDEYQSKENGKHTRRAMIANAKEGFWNGSQPPFGYKTVEAEQRGMKIKKRLAIIAGEAEIVRMIFRLYRYGDGASGPLGIKSVVSHLNGQGLQTRRGVPFSVQYVHKVLTNTAYYGTHYFNRRDSHTRQPKKREEWVAVAVPKIVDEDTFAAVQELLKARNPSQTPPRVVNSPVLLTGTAVCSDCGGPMRLRTGKSGRYRYYTCARRADQGAVACKGRSIRMDLLDGLVMDALSERILHPDRLGALLGSLVARNSGIRERTLSEIKGLDRERRDVQGRIDALYEAIETRTIEWDSTLRERVAEHQERKEQLGQLHAIAERRLNAPVHSVTEGALAAFSEAIRDRLRDGPPAFRKGYLRLLVERVEVGDSEIRISGSKTALLEQATTDSPVPPAVPIFEQEWRTRQDSNL